MESFIRNRFIPDTRPKTEVSVAEFSDSKGMSVPDSVVFNTLRFPEHDDKEYQIPEFGFQFPEMDGER